MLALIELGLFKNCGVSRSVVRISYAPSHTSFGRLLEVRTTVEYCRPDPPSNTSTYSPDSLPRWDPVSKPEKTESRKWTVKTWHLTRSLCPKPSISPDRRNGRNGSDASSVFVRHQTSPVRLYLDLALWSVVLWSVVCGCCSSCCYVGVQLRSNGSLPSQPLPVAKGSLCEFFTLKLVGC